MNKNASISSSPVWPRGLPAVLHVPETSLVYNVECAARRYPHKTAIQYLHTSVSYAELLESIERFAAYLQQVCKVRPGDRVLLSGQNCPQFVIANYAILRADAVVVPANPMWLTSELEHVVRDAELSVAVIAGELYGAVAPLHGPLIEHVIRFDYADMLGPDVPDAVVVPAWLRARAPWPDQPAGSLVAWRDAMAVHRVPEASGAGPDTLCLLAYTSGTTGHPKACMHTHHSIMSAVVGSQIWRGNNPEAVFLAVAPMFHMMGFQNCMNAPLYLGATSVLMPRWDRALAIELIERYRVSSWSAPPAMLVDFFALPGIETRDLSSLSFLGGGGAAMPEAVSTILQKRLGIPYIEAYGMTETASFLLSNPHYRHKQECLGIPTFGVDARVIDPETKVPLPAGETGEIVAHGPQIMLGYWHNPAANLECFINIDGKRFLRTGDLGYVDEEGYFFMRDRLKRMINASGYKVWPAEVENLLYAHPDIHEACVVAAPDPKRGETVKAYIVLKSPAARADGSVTEEAVIAWCRERLAAYKVPRIVTFIEALPKSGTGKVQWRALQEQERE